MSTLNRGFIVSLKLLTAIAAFIFSIISTSAYSQAGQCGDPPPVQDETLKGEIAGKAQFLSRFLGDAALTGKIETARSEIFSKYPYGERSNAYFQYQVCILLMQDTSMSTIQKLDELKKIQREFTKPIVPQRVDAICKKLYHKATIGDPGSWKDSVTASCASDSKIIACQYWKVPENNGPNDVSNGPISGTNDCSCTCQHEAKEGVLHEGDGHWCGCYPVAVCATQPENLSGSLEDVVKTAIAQSDSCK